MSRERSGSSRPELFDEERAVPIGGSRRRNLIAVVVVLGVGALGGGISGWYFTHRRPPRPLTLPVPGSAELTGAAEVATTTTAAPTTTIAPTTTVAPTTTESPTTVAPTTVAPTTTEAPPSPTNDSVLESVPPPSNPQGAQIGKPADPNSFNSAERWAAQLGTSQAEAALSSKAALYTRWFQMALGPVASAVVTARGFRETLADGSVVDLVDLVAAGGKVADLTECPGGEEAGACQRVGDFVDLAALEAAGASPSVSVRWFGRVRLRSAQWALYAMVTTKPVSSVAAPYTARFDGTTLMITGAPPGQSVNVTVNFADATTEVIAVGT